MSDPDTVAEMSAVRDGHDASQTQQDTLAFADELFNFDPTLDPSKTAQQNADAIYTRAVAQLPCAMVMVSNTTITVTAATPCTGPNGVSFSGTVSAGVAKNGNALAITLTFTNAKLGDATLNGTTTLTTTDGTTFSVVYALTKNQVMVSGNLTATGAPNQITVDGSLMNSTLTAAFTKVLWKKGDCYPSSGSMSITQGRLTTTYTFNAQTPSTGMVTTGRNKQVQLPAYGSCPHASDAGP